MYQVNGPMWQTPTWLWRGGDTLHSSAHLLFHLRCLSARQWAALAMYIETPVDDGERARLVGDLQDAIRSEKDKALALAALDEMVKADGQVTEDVLFAVAAADGMASYEEI